MAYILFIGYMNTHLVLRILSNSNISIGLHRCYFFLSHELIITWYYRLYFIYVWVCLFLCSEHIELSLKGQIHSYLRQRDWFKNKPRRIEKKKKIDVNFYLNVLFCICMSLIPLQAMCHFTFNKSGYTFPFECTHFSCESRKVSTCW
jgi:hypothetical protein